MNARAKKPTKSIARRPFAPGVWAQANLIVRHYRSVVWFEDGEWFGQGLELPSVMADGKTPTKCVHNLQQAMTATAAWMIEQGKKLPRPVSKKDA